MAKRFFRTAIIDDHPLIADAYRSALNKIFSELKKEVQVSIFTDIDEVLKELRTSNFERFDMMFLDMRLPASSEGKILSGEDLGMEIRNKYPDIKLVVATTYNDNYRIHSILKSLNPEGFLIKNDLTPESLIICIQTLVNGSPYYSETVLNLMRKQISEDMILDKIDRKLLYELSIGTKMKELPDILYLSTGGVERRKRNLKMIFNVEDESDRDLVKIARDKGFV